MKWMLVMMAVGVAFVVGIEVEQTRGSRTGRRRDRKKEVPKCYDAHQQVECGPSKECCNPLDCRSDSDTQEDRCLTSRRCIQLLRLCNPNSTFDECCGGTRCVYVDWRQFWAPHYRCVERDMSKHTCPSDKEWCTSYTSLIRRQCCKEADCTGGMFIHKRCRDASNKRNGEICKMQTEACKETQCCPGLVCLQYYETYATCEDPSVQDIKDNRKCNATDELCDGKCCARGHCRRREGREAICDTNLCLNKGYECQRVTSAGTPSDPCCPGLNCDETGKCVEPKRNCSAGHKPCAIIGEVGDQCCSPEKKYCEPNPYAIYPRYRVWKCDKMSWVNK